MHIVEFDPSFEAVAWLQHHVQTSPNLIDAMLLTTQIQLAGLHEGGQLHADLHCFG